MVGVTGPMGSGLPQLGFPRRLAMKNIPSISISLIPKIAPGIHRQRAN
jgi:hypothetical protein